MSEAKRVEVANCGVCPFAWDGSEVGDKWRCTATDRGYDFKPIGMVHQMRKGWLPPPHWCPLRKRDHIVALRKP